MPLEVGGEVHHVGDTVVEATDDEQRHTEEHGQERPCCLAAPGRRCLRHIYGTVDDESAADGLREGFHPRVVEPVGDHCRQRLVVVAAVVGCQSHDGAADDVEEPHHEQVARLRRFDDACHTGIERHTHHDDTHQPEGENHGAG